MTTSKPIDEIAAAVAELSEAEVERLLFRLSASVRRRRKLDCRDGLIRDYADKYYADRADGHARAILNDLRSFESRGYRRSSVHDSDRESILRAILDAGQVARRVPAERQLLNILAGRRTPGPK